MQRLVLIMVLGFSQVGHGAPPVIYDSGKTQSLMGYLVHVKHPKPPFAKPPNGPMPSVYPVNTPELSPNTVTPRAIDYPQLEQPLFIVGYDSLSVRWLKTFYNTLLQHKAVGLVVNVANPAQLAAIQAVVPGLQLYPGSGSQLAQTIGLKHYPALVSQSRIEQ